MKKFGLLLGENEKDENENTKEQLSSKTNVAHKLFTVGLAFLIGITNLFTCSCPRKAQNQVIQKSETQKIKFKEPVAVLLYHRVADGKGRTLPAKILRHHIKYLKEKGYDTLFLDELFSNPQKAVVLTFDDPREDFYLFVFPMLKEFKVKATIFPIVCTIGKKGWLSWAQLKEMQESGFVDVQSHTMTHRLLTYLTEEEIWYELFFSKKILEEQLGKEVKYIAWPYGEFNEKAMKIAKKAGYKGFLTVSGEKNQELDLTNIKRIDVKHYLAMKGSLRKLFE